MRQLLITMLSILTTGYLFAQSIPTKQELVSEYGFEQQELSRESEEIVYYIYQQGTAKKTKLVLYLQGSDPSPLFSYQINKEEVKKYCFLRGDFRNLSEEYLFVAIEKIGFEGVIDESNIPKPKIYQEKNSLDNRVFRANEVINHLNSTYQFDKIIVYGHSEGAPVAARLATQNKTVTHLGFWAGNALPDYFDFALEVRKEYYRGNLTPEKAQKQIDEVISGFVEEIAQDTSNVNMEGYTNLRWWSYAAPPINDLLKLDIPVYVQVATEDESAPIESSYLIPLEFARLGKSNLTYKVCVGCDHGFNIKKKQGKIDHKWNEIFLSFMQWTEKK